MAMTFLKSAFMDLIKCNNTFHWFLATFCLEPRVCRYRFIQSVHQHCMYECVCVCSLHVVMFYIILRLYKSTVAPGPSLGVGNRERGFKGV